MHNYLSHVYRFWIPRAPEIGKPKAMYPDDFDESQAEPVTQAANESGRSPCSPILFACVSVMREASPVECKGV